MKHDNLTDIEDQQDLRRQPGFLKELRFEPLIYSQKRSFKGLGA
ncbi:hypothetical protein [Moorena producens]